MKQQNREKDVKSKKGRDIKGKRTGRNNRKSVLGSVCTVSGTLMIIAVILLCAVLAVPGFFGYHVYTVISGSMEPAIKTGSLIYVQETKPEEVQENDIIAFYSSLENGGIITHRVTANNVVMGTFRTKGDANAGEDPSPVAYDNLIGTVKITVPELGGISEALTSFYGKILAACLIGAGALLNGVGTHIKESAV